MLQIRNLSVYYEETAAVQEVSIDFLPGRITGLIGPNGAGKSTLLKSCAGILTEYQGEILLDKQNIREDLYRLKSSCGYAPEDAVLLPYLKGREFLELVAAIRRIPAADEEINKLLTLLGLTEQAEELIINYSHGMLQKASIAAALVGVPRLLILDEALNGLDAPALFRLKKYLNTLTDNGHIIILSSHVIPLIREWCHTIAIMHRGKILRQMSREEVLQTEKELSVNFEEYFIRLTSD